MNAISEEVEIRYNKFSEWITFNFVVITNCEMKLNGQERVCTLLLGNYQMTIRNLTIKTN